MKFGLVELAASQEAAANNQRRWLMPFAQEIAAAIKRPTLCRLFTSGIREWIRRQDCARVAAFVAWHEWHQSGEAEKALAAAEERAAAVKQLDCHDVARVCAEHVARLVAKKYTTVQVEGPLPLRDRQYTSIEQQVILAAVHDHFAKIADWKWIGPNDSRCYTALSHEGVPTIQEDHLPILKAWLAGFTGRSKPNKPPAKNAQRAGLADQIYAELTMRIRAEHARIVRDEAANREPLPPTRPVQKELAKQFKTKACNVTRCLDDYQRLREMIQAFNDCDSLKMAYRKFIK